MSNSEHIREKRKYNPKIVIPISVVGGVSIIVLVGLFVFFKPEWKARIRSNQDVSDAFAPVHADLVNTINTYGNLPPNLD